MLAVGGGEVIVFRLCPRRGFRRRASSRCGARRLLLVLERAQGGVAIGGAGPGLLGLLVAVLRRNGGREIVQQVSRRVGDLGDGAVEDLLIRLEGLVVPAILRTYCSAAACTSSFVAAGSKLWRVWMFRHMPTRYARVPTCTRP